MPLWRLCAALVCATAFSAAACGGGPRESQTGAGAFAMPTGPTTFDVDGRDLCPLPPAPQPEGCTLPPPPGGPPGSPDIPVSPYVWMPEGARLDNSAAGFSGVVADTSTVQLADGRWRMYLYAGGQNRSATSQDGLAFAMDAGARLPVGFGHVRVLRLPDGRIRAYSAFNDGIASFISGDQGTTFTREDGLRLSSSRIGFTPSGISNIVRTSDGLWRAYFSTLPRPGEAPLPHKIRSASSVDLLTWTLDPDIRIGPGSMLTGSAEHPAAIGNPDGSVSLFYFRNSNFKMLMATAADGLTFTSEFDTGLSNGNDPDLVPLPDGSVRMYYNWGNDAGGAIYSALYVGAPFAASAEPGFSLFPAEFGSLVPGLR